MVILILTGIEGIVPFLSKYGNVFTIDDEKDDEEMVILTLSTPTGIASWDEVFQSTVGTTVAVSVTAGWFTEHVKRPTTTHTKSEYFFMVFHP
jgi:hypothetical protein